MQHLQLLAGALLGLFALGVGVALVLKRAPFLLVADTLPGNRYGGADDVGEVIGGPDDAGGVARTGVDATADGPDSGDSSTARSGGGRPDRDGSGRG